MIAFSRRHLLAGAVGVAATGLISGSVRAAAAPPPALFVAAHPDDEILGPGGVALVEHLAATPGQDIHILWLTRGTASGVRAHLNGAAVNSWWKVLHNPTGEGYAVLDPAEFGSARIREATVAVRSLASGLPGTLTLHEAGLLDGQVTQADAYTAILAAADAIAPGGPVRIKTHTHLVDDGPDHLAAGRAARQLRADIPTRFSDLRHYVLPGHWSDSRLSQVTWSWDTPGAGVADRLRNACRAYGAWHPPHSYAIGYHSVPSLFDQITAAPKCMQHL